MAKPEDLDLELARLAAQIEVEEAALRRAYEMHGGDNPGPNEEPVPAIITQFGEWAVTPFGVECLVYPYQIQWDSLTDPAIDDAYWLRYLSRRDWVNLHDFAEAIRHGRRIHRFLQGISENNRSQP